MLEFDTNKDGCRSLAFELNAYLILNERVRVTIQITNLALLPAIYARFSVHYPASQPCVNSRDAGARSHSRARSFLYANTLEDLKMSHRRACDLSTQERAEIIRESEIGERINDLLLMRLAESSTAIDFRRRRFIYRQDDVVDALYIIARGRVKLCSIDGATAREAVIDILGVGSLFGESALYSFGGRAKSAVAYENARLVRIPVGVFQEGMEMHRELYDYILRLVGQRLVRAERRVVNFALDAIPARLDKLLVELSERYGRDEQEGVLIDLALPHREIASILGSTRESVTVRLNALRRAGMIEFVDRKILIKRQHQTATL